ncbi:hypothetical protein [Aquincola sp. J276]|uniref:hypothetical protein n=1 Tax=Aquincola sp. J276 TaxID=2898432 RepID=UPI002150C53E|nr:hypothetical protein [Aquincola sp. J276]MCR5868508.1 hypothetical protein [Aquincola sp. J276]
MNFDDADGRNDGVLEQLQQALHVVEHGLDFSAQAAMLGAGSRIEAYLGMPSMKPTAGDRGYSEGRR